MSSRRQTFCGRNASSWGSSGNGDANGERRSREDAVDNPIDTAHAQNLLSSLVSNMTDTTGLPNLLAQLFMGLASCLVYHACANTGSYTDPANYKGKTLLRLYADTLIL